MGDVTITLQSGSVELRGTIRTVDDLKTLIDRLMVIAGWLEIDVATRPAKEDEGHG